jgi:phosphodiesterase/alkaline phosphatase D-like protein
MNDEPAYLPTQRDIYAAIARARPDFFLIGGDAVYVDAWHFWQDGYEPGINATAADIWRRYTESWLALDLYHQETLIPTLATWDDHDFALNDGTRDFLYAADALHAFTSFFGADDLGDTAFGYRRAGLGVAAAFHVHGDVFALLDNRTYRMQPNDDPDGHWGAAQGRWLEKIIAAPARAWVVSGNQFQGAHHDKETLSRFHPAAFARFLADVGRRPEGAVTLLSGDTHTTEVQRYPTPGGPILEFTVSPLHSRITDKHIALNRADKPNALRLAHPEGGDLGAQVPNFAVFDAAPGTPRFTFTMVDASGAPIRPPVEFSRMTLPTARSAGLPAER